LQPAPGDIERIVYTHAPDVMGAGLQRETIVVASADTGFVGRITLSSLIMYCVRRPTRNEA